MFKRLNLILAAGLVTALTAGSFMATAAPPTEKSSPDKKAVSKKQDGEGQSAKRKRESAGMRNPTARQGTPVLGVVIGKPVGDESAEVVRVRPGSPAEKAGLQAGDQIVKVDGDEVKSPEALRVAILEREPGDKVQLSLVRDGKSESVEVRLGGADGLVGWARRGTVTRRPQAAGWLGVRLAPMRSSTAAGVIVTRIFPGSPAAKAGLEKGDQILQIDKTRVEAAADLQLAVAGREPGETVEFVVRREGERKRFKVELGSYANWHEDLAELTEDEVRELVRELSGSPLSLARELLGDSAAQQEPLEEQVTMPTTAVAVLSPTKGNKVQGEIVLRETEDGLHLSGKVTGLKPGMHGFHIHEYGDRRDPQAKSAGGHFNPRGTAHGGPEDEEHHAGDLGNIKADKKGVAEVDITAPWLKLHYAVGRSIVVHAGEDDLRSQPSGDAGPRVAIGVIGIAEAAE